MLRKWLVITTLFYLALARAPIQAQSCSNSGTNVPTSVVFTNYLSEAVTIFWRDYTCNEIEYGTLNYGMSLSQPTYNGHEWVIRGANGEEILQVVITETDTQAIDIGEPTLPLQSPLDFTYRPDSDVTWTVIEDTAGCEPRDTTVADGLDPFYRRMCDYMGIPIASSANVPPEALQATWHIIANMMQGHSQALEKMLENKLIVGVVADSEGITVLPEYAFLRDDPQTDWDSRARGLGANPSVPLSSVGEENVLCYTTDPYFGESIMVHEFAHTLKDMGLALVDPTFNQALQLAYDNAIADGLWENTYASTNLDEYWAEGVQDYFNTNLEADPTDGIHNQVNTRAELEANDPTLYSIIDTVFGGFEWTAVCEEWK